MGCVGRFVFASAIGSQLHEHVMIQSHSITFATVEIGGQSTAIRNDLRRILRADFWLQRDTSEPPAAANC
jgi:hypothetical protein